MAANRRLAAIMFTDIAGYTALAQADEAGAWQLLRDQERILRPLLTAHRGRKVKSIGDGLLLQFPNALDAVQCGVEFQRRAHEHNAQQGGRRLDLRIGIHLGDVQRHGADIFGDAVNIASRVEPLAEPGGVWLSAQVFDQVHNKVPFQLERMGARTLKGLRDPVDVYRVVLPWTVSAPPAGAPEFPKLAVLPLTNISPDPKDEYLADGLTEELISVLSQIRGLRVISRTSVGQFKGSTKSIGDIGAQLGVSAVLEGSVRKAGDQLRIVVQLIDVRSEEHRWAKTYDRRLENVFAIQAEVAESTAHALRIELLSSERRAIQERPTENLVAYEHYLRGLQAYRRFEGSGSEDSDREAVRCFEAAVREDPNFSTAYAYLANQLLGVIAVSGSATEMCTRARPLVAKALSANPDSSDAHSALGNLVMQADLNWTRAEAEFQQAISLNPSSSTAHFWYGLLLSVVERPGQARKQFLSAIELDPLWLLPRLNLVRSHELSGDLRTAVSTCEQLLETFGENRSVLDHLAWAYVLAGQVDEALRLVGPLAGSAQLAAREHRCEVLALAGQPSEMRALLADLEAGRFPQYIPLVVPALYHAALGDRAEALTLLERDHREGDRVLWSFYQSELFDRIRDEPRFLALLKAMNLPETLTRPLHPPLSPAGN